MPETNCPAVVTVGEPQARATVKVHCVRTDEHTLHLATFNGVTRQWTDVSGAVQLRDWSAAL